MQPLAQLRAYDNGAVNGASRERTNDGGRPLRGTSYRLAECEGVAADFPYAETIWDFLFP